MVIGDSSLIEKIDRIRVLRCLLRSVLSKNFAELLLRDDESINKNMIDVIRTTFQ